MPACAALPVSYCEQASSFGYEHPYQAELQGKRGADGYYNEAAFYEHPNVHKRGRVAFTEMPVLVPCAKQERIASQASCSVSYPAPARYELPVYAVHAPVSCRPPLSPGASEPDYSSCDLDFLQHCLEDEGKSSADHQYLNTVQRDIDAHKRLVLVDWLIEVADEFKLGQETLFLSVNLLDRFLSLEAVPRARLQLLGVTCIWLAAKYEEVFPPCLADFVDMTDQSYSGRDLIAMEVHLLQTLRYTLSVPTSISFLQQFLSVARPSSGAATSTSVINFGMPTGSGISSSGCSSSSSCSSSTRRAGQLAEYLLELSLLTPDALQYRPSVAAAAALALARKMLGSNAAAGPGELSRAVVAGSEAQVLACMLELARMHEWASSTLKPPVVKEKYCHRHRGAVAYVPMREWW